ncbi:MAG: DUF2793 domain-containing protein [Thiotrichaceae bacterium]
MGYTLLEDPAFTDTVTVGGNGGTYRFDAMSKELHSNQSFILELTLIKPSGGGAFDISGSTVTLFVSAFNNSDPNGIFILDGGVLSDSGSGTIDRVTFTVVKDLIPDSLGGFPQRRGGNSRFYAIFEDADSILELSEGVNIIDPNFAGTGTIDPGAGAIVVSKNDLGSVVDVTVTTPPTPDLGVNYIVPAAGATGDWVGHDNEYTTGNGTDWLFTIPVDGNFVFDEAANLQTRFNAGVWAVDTDLVTSVFGRIGAVVFEAGDATADLITNVPAGNIVAVEVQAAIDELDANDDTQQTTIDLNSAHRVNASNPHGTDAADVLNDSALWNAIKLFGKALSAAMATPTNGSVPTYNSGSGEYDPVVPSAGSGGAGVAFQTNFETDVTASEPASGGQKFNSATLASVTIIRVSTTDANGVDITDRLSTIGSGDSYYTRDLNDNTKWIKVNVVSSAFVTTSYNITCTFNSGGVLPSAAATMGIDPAIITVGGATGVALWNSRAGNVLPALGDYLASLITDDSAVGGVTVADSLDILNNLISPEAVAGGTDNDQVGVAYTLVLTDKDNGNVYMNNALPNTLTIPTNASVAFPTGTTKIPAIMEGVGVTTIAAFDGTVTVNGVPGGSVVINNQFQGATLQKRGTNTWLISGDIT